jgi:hypothetical protein
VCFAGRPEIKEHTRGSRQYKEAEQTSRAPENDQVLPDEVYTCGIEGDDDPTVEWRHHSRIQVSLVQAWLRRLNHSGGPEYRQDCGKR